MKWLFFVFLLANLLVFGLVTLGGSNPAVDPRSREINASKIQIVTGELAKRSMAATASAVVETSASAVQASAPAIASEPASRASAVVASAAPTRSVCLRWSGFTATQASIARNQLKTLGLSATESGGTEHAKVWVYIPPQPSQTDARRKAQEVAELGGDDYFVVNDGGRWQNAVSLGIFSTREAGERRLAELRAKGIRSAIMRDKDDTLKPVTFLVRDVSAPNRQKLENASKRLRGIELRETACR